MSDQDQELRHQLLPWVQRHLIRNYNDGHIVSHTEAVEQLIALVKGRPVPRFYDEIAGELHPALKPCDHYVGDGRSYICSACDWPEVTHILHDSDWECDECGGPSPATSMSGCAWCGGQGDIVPRGQARRRIWTPRAARR